MPGKQLAAPMTLMMRRSTRCSYVLSRTRGVDDPSISRCDVPMNVLGSCAVQDTLLLHGASLRGSSCRTYMLDSNGKGPMA